MRRRDTRELSEGTLRCPETASIPCVPSFPRPFNFGVFGTAGLLAVGETQLRNAWVPEMGKERARGMAVFPSWGSFVQGVEAWFPAGLGLLASCLNVGVPATKR